MREASDLHETWLFTLLVFRNRWNASWIFFLRSRLDETTVGRLIPAIDNIDFHSIRPHAPAEISTVRKKRSVLPREPGKPSAPNGSHSVGPCVPELLPLSENHLVRILLLGKSFNHKAYGRLPNSCVVGHSVLFCLVAPHSPCFSCNALAEPTDLRPGLLCFALKTPAGGRTVWSTLDRDLCNAGSNTMKGCMLAASMHDVNCNE